MLGVYFWNTTAYPGLINYLVADIINQIKSITSAFIRKTLFLHLLNLITKVLTL